MRQNLVRNYLDNRDFDAGGMADFVCEQAGRHSWASHAVSWQTCTQMPMARQEFSRQQYLCTQHRQHWVSGAVNDVLLHDVEGCDALRVAKQQV